MTAITCSNVTANALSKIIPLLSSYSAMTIAYSGTYNGTSGPTPINYTASYNVVSSNSSGIEVNLSYKSTNTTESIAALISTNGTVLSVSVNGQTIPSQYASSMVVGLFAGFIIEIQNAQSISVFTGSQFHSTGTSQVTIGSVSFTVTNYAANSLPVSFSYCGGSDVLTSFKMSIGTPSGASVPVVTYMNFVGTSTSNGQTSSVNFTLQVTALTVG
jgi:hypothetical protein